MSVEEMSRRRGATGEITFIAPVKPGLVPGIGAQITYSDRLRLVLSVFNDRENGWTEQAPEPLGLRAFQGIHFAHLVLLDGDTRFLFAVNFDGSASDYLAALTTDIPWLIHLVFSNCVGWESIAGKPEVLIRFIARHQTETNFWYAHAPQLTVRDLDWLQELRRKVEHPPQACDAAMWSRELQAEASQHCAPRPFKRVLQQLFAAQPNAEQARARAKLQFRAVFESLYSQNEWRPAYQETFDELPEGVA